MENKKFDLSDRLEDFAANIIIVYDKPPNTYAGDYLAKQLMRSACSAALNYGEALGASTKKDKINKMSICLKELRECLRNLNIQFKANLKSKNDLTSLQDENDQLIRISVTLIRNLKEKPM